jgi:hypothetical protein
VVVAPEQRVMRDSFIQKCAHGTVSMARADSRRADSSVNECYGDVTTATMAWATMEVVQPFQ